MTVRIGLIGCGAVAAAGHLPALAALRDQVATTVLVDLSLERAERMAAEYGVPRAMASYREALDEIDAAIIALPHALHAPVTIDLLEAGKHVLVEKPMALTTRDCDRMIEAAAQTGRVLAVGLVRRFCPVVRLVQGWIDQGAFGPLADFDVQEGMVFASSVASDTLFRRDMAGGGVLPDTGIHVLDTLACWLGVLRIDDYRDDAHGGVEADCALALSTLSSTRGRVTLSRVRALRNSFRLRFAAAEIHVGTGLDQSLRLTLEGCPASLQGTAVAPAGPAVTLPSLMAAQLRDFVDAIRDRRPPRVPGEAGRISVELVEQCYARRLPLDEPWLTWPPDVALTSQEPAAA